MSTQNSSEAKQPRRPRCRVTPTPPRDYLLRHELLAMVPMSMGTIRNLEKRGIFPSRFRLEPTNRVAWKRQEVVRFMEQRARKRVHPPADVEAASNAGKAA